MTMRQFEILIQRKALLTERFKENARLHAEIVTNIQLQFAGHRNLNAMLEMASLILAEKHFDEKMAEINGRISLIQSSLLKTNLKSNEQKELEPNELYKERLDDLEELINQLNHDVATKEKFIGAEHSLINKDLAVGQLQRAKASRHLDVNTTLPSKDDLLNKEVKRFYKKFRAYEGTIDVIDDVNLEVPSDLPRLFKRDTILMQHHARYANLLKQHRAPAMIAMNATENLSLAENLQNKIEHNKVTEGLGKAAQAVFKPLTRKARNSAEQNPDTTLSASHDEEWTAEKETQLASMITLYAEKPTNVTVFQQRLTALKEKHAELEQLKQRNAELLAEYRKKDVKNLEEQCKDVLKDVLKPFRDIKKMCEDRFGSDESEEDINLLVEYEALIKETAAENQEIEDRIKHLDTYYAALADVKASQLSRAQIIKKFDDIRQRNKLNLQKYMFIEAMPLLPELELIVRGGLKQNQRYGMKEDFDTQRNLPDFEEEVNSNVTLWNQICSRFASTSTGVVAGAAAYAVSNTVMDGAASLVMGALVGSAFASASHSMWESKFKGDKAQIEANKKLFEAELKNSVGEDLINCPELKDLSINIEKLMHYRDSLLNKKSSRRRNYLLVSGLDSVNPPLTDLQIDRAIHAFFATELVAMINDAVTAMYELNDEAINDESRMSIITKKLRALVPGMEPTSLDKYRFTEFMVQHVVESIKNRLINKTEEMGYWGNNPKMASAVAGLIGGLMTALAIVSIIAATATPFGWGMVALVAVGFVLTAIPSGYFTNRYKTLWGKYNLSHSKVDNAGVKETIKMLDDEHKRMVRGTTLKKVTSEKNVEQLAGMAANSANPEQKAEVGFFNLIKRVFGIEADTYAMCTTDGWFRQLSLRIRSSKLILADLQNELQTLEEQSTKQVSRLQASLLTGHLRENHRNHKPILEYVKRTQDFLENKKHQKLIADFRIKEMIREEILQVVAVAGIHGGDVDQDNALVKIPQELKDFYTGPLLGGALDDFRMARATAKLENVLQLADGLERELMNSPYVVLAGSNLYRESVGFRRIHNGLYITRKEDIAEKITPATITKYLENSYQFLLSLDRKEAEPYKAPLFRDEYVHSKQYTLYKTMLMKQLAELVDPNYPGFDPLVSHEVMCFVENRWQLKSADVEEMFLQVQHQEFVTEAHKSYSLITINEDPINSANDKVIDRIKSQLQEHYPAYILFADKVYLLEKNKQIQCIFNAQEQQAGEVQEQKHGDSPQIKLEKIFPKLPFQPDFDVNIRTALDIEAIMQRSHTTPIAAAIRVDLAFGLPKMTPEKTIMQVVAASLGLHKDEEDGLYKDKAGIEKRIFALNIKSASRLNPMNAVANYAGDVRDFIYQTEAFLEEILKKIAVLKDTDAPEIYLKAVQDEVAKVIENIDAENVRAANPWLADAKRALELHLNNLEMYGLMIKVAKLVEDRPVPVATPVDPGKRTFNFFHFRKAKPVEVAAALSPKEEVLAALSQGLTKDERKPAPAQVNLVGTQVITVTDVMGVKNQSVAAILGNHRRLNYVAAVPQAAANDAAEPAPAVPAAAI